MNCNVSPDFVLLKSAGLRDDRPGLVSSSSCPEEVAVLSGVVSLFHILKRHLPVRPISNSSEKRSELGFVYQVN